MYLVVDTKVDQNASREEPATKSVMSTVEVQETKKLENESFSSCTEQRNLHPVAEISGKLPNIELEPAENIIEKEEEDQFDVLSPPVTHKKEHATQSTLEFVYHHSSSTSPSQVPANFPISPGIVPTNHRSMVTHRRPSGVPPPPRELKPGDYLYQRNLNNNFELSEELEDEEDEIKNT